MFLIFGTLRGRLIQFLNKAKLGLGYLDVKLAMENVNNVYFSPLPDSSFLKPMRMNYTQNGKKKSWDFLEGHGSVAIILFNISREVMIFVKQFRPAIYYHLISPADRKKSIDTKKYSPKAAITLEICAGIDDKNKPLEVIAQEEILEECGYKVDLTHLEKVMSYRGTVSVQGGLQTLYYCEVTDSMKIEEGGGVDGEMIEVVEMSIPEIELMILSSGPHVSPPTCLFGIMWFLRHKANKFRKSRESTIL